MSSTQKHRRGATTRPSSLARAKSLLDRASDLEHQLNSLQKSNEEKAARLRSHLCEVLSDILISDPTIGQESDCTGRLWRNCFYSPIVIWRKKINREKRKKGQMVKSLHQNFKKFLGEAVTLYDYLVVQYQSKLIPSASQDHSQQSTQESTTATVGFDEGVVPVLFRLYLNMGDLHRYAESYNNAETCYLNASKLAPGMGNPYNQLAVVSQMKDSNLSCVALYYYTRSLLATHDSFETSSSNLERLFSLNRDYLDEHSRNSSPPVLDVGGSKKPPTDMIRAQKAAASKACLAHFVDLHHDLFKDNGPDVEQRTRDKMNGIIKSFESLLQTSALSDSLLTKMIVINIFATHVKKDTRHEESMRLSLDFFLDFGTSLASKLRTGVSKLIERSEQAKQTYSIRLLVPFCIICEFVGNLTITRQKTIKSMAKFWKEIASIGNLFRRLLSRIEEESQHSVKNSFLKEYQLMKGFMPLSSLFPPYVNESPFVGSMEAVDMLELSLTRSQESTKQAVIDENSTRIVCLLNFCDRCITNSDVPLVLNATEYEYVDSSEEREGQETCTSLQSLSKESPSGDAQIDNAGKAINEAGDVVLFKSPGYEGGPTLLVPGTVKECADALYEAPTDSTFTDLQVSNLPPSDTQVKGPDIFSHLSLYPLPYSPPVGIKPPPGFGATITPSSTSTQVRPLDSAATSQFGLQQSFPSITGLQAFTTIHALPSSQQTPPLLQRDPVVAQPSDNVRGLEAVHTRNPFSNAASAYFGIAPTSSNVKVELDAVAADGSSLLNSGLLDSLWMNESDQRQTDNPFVQ